MIICGYLWGARYKFTKGLGPIHVVSYTIKWAKNVFLKGVKITNRDCRERVCLYSGGRDRFILQWDTQLDNQAASLSKAGHIPSGIRAWKKSHIFRVVFWGRGFVIFFKITYKV